MKNQWRLPAVLFCLWALHGPAQNDSLKAPNRFVRLNYDNDFFSATDYYYTQGVYLELILPIFKKTLLAKTLIPLKNGTEDNYGMSIERQAFTSISIRHNGISYGERPYAGITYFSHSLVSTNAPEALRLSTKINTGIIGPNSRCAEEQKGLHYTLKNNIQPMGWENQIENDYVLNYDLALEKGVLKRRNAEFIVSGDARVGTLYDDIGIGGMVRIGKMHPYFSDPGLTRDMNSEKFQCYIFVKGKARVIGYNATLQGGMINRNSTYTIPSDDISRFVGTVYYGIVIAYKRVGLEYTKAEISSEFKNGTCHGWGRVGVNVCF